MTMLGGAHGSGRPNVTLVDQYGNPLTVEVSEGYALWVRDVAILRELQEQTLLLKQIRMGLSILADEDLSQVGE